MGTIIKNIAIAGLSSGLLSRGYLKLGEKAAKKCLKGSSINPKDLGLIINAGIYRDQNLAEPAVASILQGRIESLLKGNKLKSKATPETSAFSFDLSNGGCSSVNGMEILDNIITLKEHSYGMIIAGDSDPIPGLSEGFRFLNSAAALILSGSDKIKGFSGFRHYNYPEYKDLFISYVSWKKLNGKPKFRNRLSINEYPQYLKECINCATKSLNDFLDSNQLTISDIDLIISSESPLGFMEGLYDRFGQKVYVNSHLKKGYTLHTSGPLFGIYYNWKEISSGQPKNIIIITVGAGITVSIALYKNYKISTNEQR